MVYASQFIFDREKNLIVKQVKNTNAKFQWFQSQFHQRELLNIVKPVCAYRICFNIRKFRSPRSSKPSMNSFVRGRSCLFLPRIPGVLFHSVSGKHFLYGTIFRRNLNEMEFLVERNKKIKRRYDKNFRRNYRRIYIFLFNNNNNFLEKMIFDEDEYSWLLSLLSPNSLETFIIKGRFMTSHIFSNFY